MAHLVLDSVTKTFAAPKLAPVEALSDVSLEVENGELLALVGPSGSGKTTLLRVIAGLEAITKGRILIGGRNAEAIAPSARGVAMVFQQPALYPHMNVAENILFSLKIRKVPKRELEDRLRDAAERMKISSLLERFPHVLSGGERQRVAVARAIAQRPQFLLFDEPLSSVDAPARLQLRREISRLHHQLQATTVYVTHDQAEAMAIGHRVAVLNKGRLEQIAAPSHLYRNPRNLFVAGFVGSPPMNFFNVRASDPEHLSDQQTLWFKETSADGADTRESFELAAPWNASSALRDYAGRRLIFGLRPEAINIIEPSHRREAGAVPDVVVELIEHLGPDTYLSLKSAHHTFTCRVSPNCSAARGETVGVQFALEQAHFFDSETEQVIA